MLNRSHSLTELRRNQIVNDLNRDQIVKVSNLSRSLGVSEVSIRRDLQFLEKEGLLKRIHGGAVIIHRTYLGSLNERMQLENEKKERISRATAALINKGERIILDSGTTILRVARHISIQLLKTGKLTVITGFLPVVQQLSGCPEVHLLLLGGIYLPNYHLVVGPQTIKQLNELHADKLILGTDGLTISHGITTANVLEADVARAMVKASSEIILVADSSKIGVIGLTNILPINRVHKLITDKDAPIDFITALRERNVEVILV